MKIERVEEPQCDDDDDGDDGNDDNDNNGDDDYDDDNDEYDDCSVLIVSTICLVKVSLTGGPARPCQLVSYGFPGPAVAYNSEIFLQAASICQV